MKISQILEGWKNVVMPANELKGIIERTRESRLKICSFCDEHSDNAKKTGYKSIRPDAHCLNCGCTLSAKTSCLSCSCPLNKWTEVLTQQEEEEIKNTLYGEKSSEA